jgi:aspartyl-tRNA(Asn)/glutamyl-tRNA(Gln) amidotransferase subunit C
MAKITRDTVDTLATLARLEFDGIEKDEIVNDLNRMLDFVSKLNELDTARTEPLIYMNDQNNILRVDTVKQEITQEEALCNAPNKNSDYFKVSKAVKKNRH